MRKRAEGRAAEVQERIPPVLSNRPFLLLWLAQIISQTAQNAILYALIIVVLDLTESTTSTSVVVLCFVVPTAGFGLFAGVLVDRWSKRRLLIFSNAARAVAAIAFFFARDHVWALYITTMFFATFSQLFTTSNAASIPHMVSRQQLISANTLFSGGFTIAQLAGLIFLAPLILTTAGAGTLFISAAGAFVVATLLTRLLPFIGHDGEEEVDRLFPSREELRGAVSEFATAMRSVRADPLSTMAMAHITASSTLILLFAILMPRYMQAILKVEADKAVTIFAPVAVGALIGLRAVPLLVSRLGKTRTVALGLFGVALCLMALGFVERIADALKQTEQLNPFGPERVFGLSILVALTMLFAGPMGIFYAMLNTPAQTTLHERTPIDMRGRVIASQMVLANGVALIPLVIVGGIADLYGVSSVVLAISGLLVLAGALTLYVERRWLQQQDEPPPPDGVKAIVRPQEPVPGSIDTT
jgi:MFS family permease